MSDLCGGCQSCPGVCGWVEDKFDTLRAEVDRLKSRAFSIEAALGIEQVHAEKAEAERDEAFRCRDESERHAAKVIEDYDGVAKERDAALARVRELEAVVRCEAEWVKTDPRRWSHPDTHRSRRDALEAALAPPAPEKPSEAVHCSHPVAQIYLANGRLYCGLCGARCAQPAQPPTTNDILDAATREVRSWPGWMQRPEIRCPEKMAAPQPAPPPASCKSERCLTCSSCESLVECAHCVGNDKYQPASPAKEPK